MSSPEILLAKSNRNRFTLLEAVIVIAAIGLVSILAVPAYQNYQELKDIEQAVNDIAAINIAVTKYQLENNKLPENLLALNMDHLRDPWGLPYQYTPHMSSSPEQQRKNKNLTPVNNDYDLYSKGKDGKSAAALSADFSHDDIVRANNGKWVGLGKKY